MRRSAATAGYGPRRRTPCALLAILAILACLLTGCANLLYSGSATTLEPQEIKREPGWVAIEGVPEQRQQGEHDCGITALDMVMRYWGATADQPGRPQKSTEERWAAAELRDVARAGGFNAFVVEGDVQDLAHELQSGRPVIVGTAKATVTGEYLAHYEVVIGLNHQTKRVATIDPAAGMRQNSFGGFLEEWLPTGSVLLVVIPPEPPNGAEPHAPAPSSSPVRSLASE